MAYSNRGGVDGGFRIKSPLKLTHSTAPSHRMRHPKLSFLLRRRLRRRSPLYSNAFTPISMDFILLFLPSFLPLSFTPSISYQVPVLESDPCSPGISRVNRTARSTWPLILGCLKSPAGSLDFLPFLARSPPLLLRRACLRRRFAPLFSSPKDGKSNSF